MNNENESTNSEHSEWYSPESLVSSEAEKQKKWDQLEHQVNEITDGLERGIDSGIKESVVAFLALDFPTNQSCSGHFNETDERDAAPWVEVYAPGPDNWQQDEKAKQLWVEQHDGHRLRMKSLLDEFYSNKEEQGDTKLEFEDIGIYGAFRVLSSGAKILQDRDVSEKHDLIVRYQEEMKDFTSFLKAKFFGKS